mmetsp:Transcript_1893/g.2095  ORF Transcript_1893/g.2095 Transcript_1893/m.2095 type:complete len:424 (+) Transcript_1893:108-1379(+)|eukprot:CAMPEP_0197852200 /NCGR_PEP_ID=MMETSP1438-20131217/19893_1 /TAXON_ID=1461541 /ORGANISM="Pterosperma sp., Strain CCMP1384" /LENGTH=423 /DNA_ID=CAMNT_0043466107 /DNA_START=56 /DNA_END=1327 /DNA_ORIENTATION=+
MARSLALLIAVVALTAVASTEGRKDLQNSDEGFIKVVDTTAVSSKPWWFETVKMARWLVHSNVWGNVATTSLHLNGTAFGDVQSYTDGDDSTSTGRLFFYGSTLDPTWQDVTQGTSRASLNLVEKQVEGYCSLLDPESPLCAKITLSGDMKVVPASDPDASTIHTYLFNTHPAFATWPASHDFQMYELHIDHIMFLDMFGGAKNVQVKDYLAATITKEEKELRLGNVKHTQPPQHSKISLSAKEGSDSEALAARKLVHANNWTSVTTTSHHLNGTAYGQVQSFVDGNATVSTGRILFYGSTMDPSWTDIITHPECSVTIVQAQEMGGNGCHVNTLDPEDPNCAKIVLSGKMAEVPATGDVDQIKDWMFAAHPAMKTWPTGHDFKLYELSIEHIFFLNHYGGAALIDVKDYFAADPLAQQHSQM